METTELGSAEQPPVAEIAPFEVVVAFPFAAFVAVVAVDAVAADHKVSH